MTAPLRPATLAYNDAGLPFSPAFNDIYYSADGGLGQARHVFLGGNKLPGRWQGRETFTIVELGFGAGLNFLATWQAWRDAPERSERLHFVSVEKHPFCSADLAVLHGQWPELAARSAELLAQWPVLTPGFHRLHLDHGRVTLTLLFGEAQDALSALSARADAFYLDGFAPSRNPELWSPELMHILLRLAAPGATVATYSAAGEVRRRLNEAGFAVTRQPGFGGKRDMLAGVCERREPLRHWRSPARTALVIGAGLAGCSTAERLAARGWQVTVLDRAEAPATKASGNHAGVLLPVLSLDDNLQSRLARAGFLHTGRQLHRLAASQPFDWGECGVLQLGRDADNAQLQRRIVERHAYPADYAEWLDRDAAGVRAGQPVTLPGWWFGKGAWVNPPGYCAALLASGGERIRFVPHADVARLEKSGDDWVAFDAAGQELARAAVAVIANATDAVRLDQTAALPLTDGQRVVTLIPADSAGDLDVVVCRNAYISPAYRGWRALGATAAPAGAEPDPTLHDLNLAKLAAMLPEAGAGLDPAGLRGRACARPTSPDRLPLVGALPVANTRADVKLGRIAREAGLYCALGFGARGLAWSALAGEIIASQLEGEPAPVEKDLLDACDPARFAWRAARHKPDGAATGKIGTK